MLYTKPDVVALGNACDLIEILNGQKAGPPPELLGTAGFGRNPPAYDLEE